MATEPFLAAEPARADVAAPFEPWRRTRATAHERIPPALWEQAVVLATILPHAQVAKRLRLRPTDLKKQCVARQGALVTDAVSPPPGFIEVTAPEWGLAAPTATLIEVERPAGARLRLHYRTAPPPLTTVLQAFLESTGGCHSARKVGSFWPWPRSISAKAVMGWLLAAGGPSLRTRWMERFTSSAIAPVRP